MKSAPFVFFLIVILTATFVSPAQTSDRITLDYGDIFLGEIESTYNYRYSIERFGFKNEVPTWWVKKIEPGVEELVSQDDLKRFPPRGINTISGFPVSVTSYSPAEASHLELYPNRSHFWMESERYLRGYLVNQSEEGYQQLKVEISYYSDKKTPVYRHQAEVFNVFPKTMKPFIVDARFVPWHLVKGVSFVVTGGVKWAKDGSPVSAENGG
ncbi:MAG: hypothetical protein P9L94_10725 [Candidatus Hinthialibacter antarcticus]|nr:hypothetical protein [Candidatus Hinthialibacter antarcticus]